MPSQDLFRYALAYAKRGWNVLPLHSVTDGVCSCGCTGKSAGKHPRSEHGVRDASSDWRTIQRWWERWPDANVGLAMGGKFWVLDLDGEEGLKAWVALQEEFMPCPKTFTVQTGNGYHLYFLVPEGVDLRNKQDCPRCPHIDRRANGGYVVAPPSAHYSGRTYQVIEKVQAILAPDWVHHIWDPPARDVPARPPAPAPVANEMDRARRYVQKALQLACMEIVEAADGGAGLHHKVYQQAASMGGYVAGGYIDEATAIEALFAAAIEAKPGADREMSRTVFQGMAKGKNEVKHPRLEGR